MSAFAVALLAVGLVGALTRPRSIPAWTLPVIAALVAVATGVVDGSEFHDVVRPLAAPIAFVLVAVPFAASLDHVGVFHELAAFAARSRHVVGALWILAALVVAFLNLDAAVVLLTPLYIRTALLLDVDPVALAFQPVLLASLASSVLVVSTSRTCSRRRSSRCTTPTSCVTSRCRRSPRRRSAGLHTVASSGSGRASPRGSERARRTNARSSWGWARSHCFFCFCSEVSRSECRRGRRRSRPSSY